VHPTALGTWQHFPNRRWRSADQLGRISRGCTAFSFQVKNGAAADEMAEAGDHVLAAYQCEQQIAVVVAEKVEARVGSASVRLGFMQSLNLGRADS
jgi:hypothetical protein